LSETTSAFDENSWTDIDDDVLREILYWYISTSSAFEYYYRLGHPSLLGHSSLLVLKIFIPSLGLISSLECELVSYGSTIMCLTPVGSIRGLISHLI